MDELTLDDLKERVKCWGSPSSRAARGGSTPRGGEAQLMMQCVEREPAACDGSPRHRSWHAQPSLVGQLATPKLMERRNQEPAVCGSSPASPSSRAEPSLVGQLATPRCMEHRNREPGICGSSPASPSSRAQPGGTSPRFMDRLNQQREARCLTPSTVATPARRGLTPRRRHIVGCSFLDQDDKLDASRVDKGFGRRPSKQPTPRESVARRILTDFDVVSCVEAGRFSEARREAPSPAADGLECDALKLSSECDGVARQRDRKSVRRVSTASTAAARLRQELDAALRQRSKSRRREVASAAIVRKAKERSSTIVSPALGVQRSHDRSLVRRTTITDAVGDRGLEIQVGSADAPRRGASSALAAASLTMRR